MPILEVKFIGALMKFMNFVALYYLVLQLSCTAICVSNAHGIDGSF